MHPKVRWETLLGLMASMGAIGLLLAVIHTPAQASPPMPQADDNDRGVSFIDPTLPRVKPKELEPEHESTPRRMGPRACPTLLAPVGPEVIYSQIDQECGGVTWTDSYESSISFLRNGFGGAIGADYWPNDCTEPDCLFVAGGTNHLYWLDMLRGDGSAINGVDLKYYSETTGPNIIRLNFRSRAIVPQLGTPHGPMAYYQMSVPGHIGLPGQATAYGLRMSTPSSVDIGAGFKAGYLVDELVDSGLPIGLTCDNLVGNGVETEEVGWLQTTSVRSGAFGVAMSLNEGWCNFDDTWPTMGWYLSADDHLAPNEAFDSFTWMDKDQLQLCDCIGTAGCIGSYWYGSPSCGDDSIPGSSRNPAGSIYIKLWAKEFGFPEPNDQIIWNAGTGTYEGIIGTPLSGVKQSCLTTLGRIATHGGDVGQIPVPDGFKDVDIYHIVLASKGPLTGGGSPGVPPGTLRNPRLRVDVDTDQPVDLYLRLWDSTYNEVANSSSDGKFASTDPERTELDTHYGEDVLLPSLDPLLIYDNHYTDPVSTTTYSEHYFVGVSWEGNQDYNPLAAGSGTNTGALGQEVQIGNYFMRLGVGHLTRKGPASSVIAERDDSIEFASSLTLDAGTTYTSGPPPEANMADLGGNHMFRGHDLGSTDPNLAASCIGDVDIYQVPNAQVDPTNYADGNGILARVQSNIHGSGNMACAIYKWDGVGAPELVAVADDMASATTRTDAIAYTVISNAATHNYYVAVTGVGAWDSGAEGDFWYASNGFLDTLPADIQVPGTDDLNTGGQGYYELKVTLTGAHADVPFADAPTQPWEPNDSFAQADANGLLPNQLDAGNPLNGLPLGDLRGQYRSGVQFGDESQNTGVYMGDGVHGEAPPTIDQGGDVDIYAFGANAGEIIELNCRSTSTQLVVPTNRGLVSRLYLFDFERTLVDNQDLFIGNYDSDGGCTGFRNMATKLQAQAPRTGTYYCVVSSGDTGKPFTGPQMPYDLTKDGTQVGGYVEISPATIYCSPAAHLGLYDLDVALMAGPPCPQRDAKVPQGDTQAPLLIYVNRRGSPILDVNPTDFTLQAVYNLPPEMISSFPTETQTAAALANGVNVRLGDLCDNPMPQVAPVFWVAGEGYATAPPVFGVAPAWVTPDPNPNGYWLNPEVTVGGALENPNLVLYFHRSENSNQDPSLPDYGDLNREDDFTIEKVYMLYPDSPDADLPIIGTFNYDPADWAYRTVSAGDMLQAKSWAVGTYGGAAVQTAHYEYVVDGGNGTSDTTIVGGDDVLLNPPGTGTSITGAGGALVVVDPGPDGVIDAGTTVAPDDVREVISRDYLYIIDRATFDLNRTPPATYDGFWSRSICQVELETGCIRTCWKIDGLNTFDDADTDGSLFRSALGEATLRDWDGPGQDRDCLTVVLDDNFNLVFLDASTMVEVPNSQINAESEENVGGLTSLKAQNLVDNCREPCPSSGPPPVTNPNCTSTDIHDIVYIGQINNGLDMTFNADAPGAPPRSAFAGAMVTNALNVAYAGIQLNDRDGDRIGDELDNCPDEPNYDQNDFDSDGVGDACSERLCAGDEYYHTLSGTQINFGNCDTPPLAADFFFVGSEPFTGTVALEGVPLAQDVGSGQAGHNADTIITRDDDAWIYDGGNNIVATLPQLSSLVVSTLTDMHLRSTQDILVRDGTCPGTDTWWTVEVTDSEGNQLVFTDVDNNVVGNMQFTRTHANGGTFEAFMLMVVDYTFTNTVPGTYAPITISQTLLPGESGAGRDLHEMHTLNGVWAETVTSAAVQLCDLSLVSCDPCIADDFSHHFFCPVVGVDDDGAGTGSIPQIDWAEEHTDGTAYGRLTLANEMAGDDVDEDGVRDCDDNCLNTANPDQADCDGDLTGDACDVEADTDGDGVPDACDNCPAIGNPGQENCDGDATGDDCDANGDSDLDGVCDAIDLCPDDYDPSNSDTDGDLTGDACDCCPNDPLKTDPGQCGCGTADTDTDGDQTPDCLDGCPTDPLKTDPGLCGCFVPDTDTDGDQTPDCNDGCPTDPNKTDPGKCGCFVPDTDTDGDQTPDCNDGCPTDPNKTDPGVCGCNVPDTDTDGDLTPDCIDNCPNEPALVDPSEVPEATCNDGIDNDCDGLTDAADVDDCGVAGCICGDVNGSGGATDLNDFGAFAICFSLTGPGGDCTQAWFDCSNMNDTGSSTGVVDLNDFATFATWFNETSTQTVPNCTHP